jgi:hypothetical protein
VKSYHEKNNDIFFLFSISSFLFAQKPQNGVYFFRFFDTEYRKFFGKCKVIIKKDSIKVIVIKDCHRKKGELIDEGILKKRSNNKWAITSFRKVDDEDYSSIDLKRKIYYSF